MKNVRNAAFISIACAVGLGTEEPSAAVCNLEGEFNGSPAPENELQCAGQVSSDWNSLNQNQKNSICFNSSHCSKSFASGEAGYKWSGGKCFIEIECVTS